MTRTLPGRTLLGALLLLGCAGPACAESVVASLSTHRVVVTSTYAGAQLAVFGVIERDGTTVARAGPYDVVVTVRGPPETVVVREKRALGPIWINREDRTFAKVPAYMAVLSSRPLQDFLDGARLQRLGLGLAAVVRDSGASTASSPEDAAFRASLMRLRFEAGLLREEERGVTFLTSGVFQSRIDVPATAPIGNYEVETALFADGALLNRGVTNFEVVKAGFEQLVTEGARERRWLYGLTAVAMSLSFGWLASVLFRRD